MERYAAGIVIYNPDLDRLKENLDSISRQVKTVYCLNNGSKNIVEIESILKEYKNVVFVHSDVNLGIATALNIITNYALSDNFEWLLTLDQDSVCPTKMIHTFSKYVHYDNVAIICPVMIDKRRPQTSDMQFGNTEVEFCITSGSFVNLEICARLGYYDDYLFVGLVDNDYCYRVRLNKYKILQINTVFLDHELGNLYSSKLKNLYLILGNILHIKKIKALSYKRKVSRARVYYAERNIIYLSKKYKWYPSKKFSATYAIYNATSNFLRGRKKIEILKAICKGIKAGKDKTVDYYKMDN